MDFLLPVTSFSFIFFFLLLSFITFIFPILQSSEVGTEMS